MAARAKNHQFRTAYKLKAARNVWRQAFCARARKCLHRRRCCSSHHDAASSPSFRDACASAQARNPSGCVFRRAMHRSPQENTNDTVKTIRVGKVGRSATLVVQPVCISVAHGPRVPLAPGLPCALWSPLGGTNRKARAKPAARLRRRVCHSESHLKDRCSCPDSSLRAQRRNPESRRGKTLDCFAALAMTVWRKHA
ncbi:hypothetical protein ACVWXO_008784 [Bradyrhizobium sp. LM2.7]